MKAKTKAKKNTVSVDMVEFARVCDGAIAETCIKGLEKGMTPIRMCDFEMRLWAAANIIGNRLFRLGERKVDFSNGRMDKVRGELEAGIWLPAEREGEHEDQGQD